MNEPYKFGCVWDTFWEFLGGYSRPPARDNSPEGPPLIIMGRPSRLVGAEKETRNGQGERLPTEAKGPDVVAPMMWMMIRAGESTFGL